METTIFMSRVNTIYFYLLCLYAFLTPTLNNLTPLVLGLLTVCTIIDFKSIKLFIDKEKKNWIVIALPIIFVLLSLSLLYSDNTDVGWALLLKKTPFLLFPFALYKTSELNNDALNKIFKLFVLGCVFTILYSYIYVLYEYIEGSYKKIHHSKNHLVYFLNRLTYHDLVSKNRVNHSIYFGAYILFAIALLKTQVKLFSKKYNVIILNLLFITLILLTPLIIAVSGIVIFTVYHILKKKIFVKEIRLSLLKDNLKWAFIVFYIFIWKIEPHLEFFYVFNNLKYNLIILFGILFSVGVGQLVYYVFSYKLLKVSVISIFVLLFLVVVLQFIVPMNIDNYQLSNYTARIINNYTSLQIIKNNFILGVGIGDVQDNIV
ncbi:MAG: hypothetical protein HRT69_15360, partial [Flavobacteriaceae bacterium]|nr:hypothetical protein [Flavobacteriaceae bacterium]